MDVDLFLLAYVLGANLDFSVSTDELQWGQNRRDFICVNQDRQFISNWIN